ncbi:MAG: MFS transporter [Arthrobacter sp.]|uniref:MFS transporter n=1 Tax=unclassified Arthrobacter TaxID=235627 RepID=UPI001D0014EC|nr:MULTISPECIES: MFS transporter [unclassified Arthrobacter]MCB5280783.1 Hexuronate transporter [Arthrobacter sp. ES1]WGZ79480.1 MFS transporter [Arthrobacter sp. EM1]
MTLNQKTTATHEQADRSVKGIRWRVLGANAGVLMLNYGDRAALGVAAPLIINEFGFSTGTMGIILGAFAFTYAPACFAGGALADKFGPRKTMAVAAAWWSLCIALTALCFNFATFFIQRLLFGLGEGPQGSVTARTMTNWFPKKEYATAMGLTFAANPLGAAVGIPLVAGLLALSNNNWRIPFLVLGAVGLIIAALWYWLIRDKPADHPRITREELALITTDDASARELNTEHVPPLRFYLRQPAVIANSIAFFGFSWLLFMFLSWYPLFLVQTQHINLSSLAWAAALPWVAGSVGTALGGILSDRLARRSGAPFRVRKWMTGFFLGLSGLLCIPLAAVNSLGLAVGLFSIVLLTLYLANVQFFAIVRDFVHPSRLGGVTGFVHFCANLAGIIAPIVTGFLIQGLGSWPAAFGLAAGLAVIGAIALILVKAPTAGPADSPAKPQDALELEV